MSKLTEESLNDFIGVNAVLMRLYVAAFQALIARGIDPSDAAPLALRGADAAFKALKWHFQKAEREARESEISE